MLKDTTRSPMPTQEKVAAMADNSIAERSSNAQEERNKPEEMARVMARQKSEISRGAPAPMEAEVAAPATQNARLQPNRSLMQSLKDEVSEANLRPDDWLLRIKKLKQEGTLEEAQKDLAGFKKRYPDYPVPRDIEVR